MFRGIVSRTRLTRHAATVVTAASAAQGAAAVVVDSLSASGSHHDVNTSSLRSAAEETTDNVQHVDAVADASAASDSTHLLQAMLHNLIGRQSHDRTRHDATEDDSSARVSATTPTISSASVPVRRRASTVMSKARRIRLAAAAQEAAEHLQKAGSPASAMVHSQHMDQLRAEEKLLEVSLQRLQAERDLAVSRHDCEADLRRFRQGVRDREDAVAAMVKAKLASIQLQETHVSPLGESETNSHRHNAGESRSTSAGTAAATPSSVMSGVETDPHVFQQVSLDGDDEEHGVVDGVGSDGVDVEHAAAMRFLIDMDATADAEAALEAAAALTPRSTSGSAKGLRRRQQTTSARSPASARKTVKKGAAVTTAATKRAPKSTAKKPKAKPVAKLAAPTRKAGARTSGRHSTARGKGPARSAKARPTPKKQPAKRSKTKTVAKPARATASKRKAPTTPARKGRS